MKLENLDSLAEHAAEEQEAAAKARDADPRREATREAKAREQADLISAEIARGERSPDGSPIEDLPEEEE